MRAVCSLLLCLALCACTDNTGPTPRLQFEKGEVSRDFQLRLRTTETPLGGRNYDNDYVASGTLLASSISTADPAVYRVKLGELLLHDRDGRLLIAFERLPSDVLRYKSDPNWDDAKRRTLFEAFGVDLSHDDPNDDNSLLQESVTIAIRSNGQIAELTISPRLRTTLQRISDGRLTAVFLRELLTHPEGLPALFPDAAGFSSWDSTGSWVTDQRWIHQRHEDSITTRSAPLPPQKLNGYDVQNDVHLEWVYEEGGIPLLEAKIYLALSRSLMNSESRAACWIDARLEKRSDDTPL